MQCTTDFPKMKAYRFLVLFAWLGFLPTLQANAEDSSSTLLKHLRFLASDELKGRGNNSREINVAAEYLAAQFRDHGLQPAGERGSYFQPFELTTGVRLGSDNQVVVQGLNGSLQLEVENSDYFPLTYGPREVVQGNLIFAGFGITAPKLHYDDYQEIDAKGKIVLIYKHEPQEQSKSSAFDGERLTPYATLMHKVMNAKHHGAVGIILLPDTFHHRNGREQTPPQSVIEDMGIPTVELDDTWTKRLFNFAGRNPAKALTWINGHLTPHSFELVDIHATISMDVAKERSTLRNVVAFISGKTDEIIVIGAHYDHLGLGDTSSLAPEQIGQVHNGADDNASGTAGLLQLAGRFRGNSLRRGLLFIAFAGEELGLRGSNFYIENPIFPLEKTVAMLNMDMIGRSEGDLLIGGVGTANEFKVLLEKLQKTSPLKFKYIHTAWGSSDHLPFALKKIPSLFFFSGLHADYHKPSDDWHKINLVRTHQVLDVVTALASQLDALPHRPQFVEVAEGGPKMHVGVDDAKPGYGPLFGSIPDMAWDSGGVRFAAIRDGSPAAKAGLRAEDILVEFDAKQIDNLYDFTYALRVREPGDEVEVKVFRDGQEIHARVRLGIRR